MTLIVEIFLFPLYYVSNLFFFIFLFFLFKNNNNNNQKQKHNLKNKSVKSIKKKKKKKIYFLNYIYIYIYLFFYYFIIVMINYYFIFIINYYFLFLISCLLFIISFFQRIYLYTSLFLKFHANQLAGWWIPLPLRRYIIQLYSISEALYFVPFFRFKHDDNNQSSIAYIRLILV